MEKEKDAMKRILVGYDGSQGSERAVNKALSIIDEGGEIVLLAVIPCREGKGFLDSDAHELARERAEEIIEGRISLIAREDITVRGNRQRRRCCPGDNRSCKEIRLRFDPAWQRRA